MFCSYRSLRGVLVHRIGHRGHFPFRHDGTARCRSERLGYRGLTVEAMTMLSFLDNVESWQRDDSEGEVMCRH